MNSKKIVDSVIWKLFEQFSSQIVSFIISIILARILLPSDYGVIAIILVFISFANVIVDGGLNTALIQKKNADQIDFSTIFWFTLLISVILYSLLFISAPFIAYFYKNEILVPILRVLSVVLFFNSFNSIQRAYVSRHMLFRKLFYVNAVAVILSGILGIVMAYSGFGVWALVGQTLFSPIVGCLLMLWSIRWFPTFEFSKEHFKPLFSFGWKIFLTNLIITIYENVRSLIIGKIYQPATLAYFDRGKALPNLLMSNVTTSINTVLLPSFSEEQDNAVRVKQMMRRSVQVSYLFVAPLLVGFFFASKEIVLFLLTDKWLPTVPFIKIFCIAFLLMPIQNINVTAIQSLGYSNITLKIELIKKIIEAIILVVSFMIDVYAVAWGIVLYNAICIIINLSPTKKLIDYGVIEQIKDVLPTLLLALVMGVVVFSLELLGLNNTFTLFLQIFIGGAIYYYLCRLIKLNSFIYVKEYIKNLRRSN